MDKEKLAERLIGRFKGVPNFREEDAVALIEDAIDAHKDKDVSDELILLYAQAEGTTQISVQVAHFFKFSDGEESIDKSMISENYRKLASDLRKRYDDVYYKYSGSNFSIMTRIDRP